MNNFSLCRHALQKKLAEALQTHISFFLEMNSNSRLNANKTFNGHLKRGRKKNIKTLSLLSSPCKVLKFMVKAKHKLAEKQINKKQIEIVR